MLFEVFLLENLRFHEAEEVKGVRGKTKTDPGTPFEASKAEVEKSAGSRARSGRQFLKF